MNIGIFGGSFDPPHAGHELLMRLALKKLNLNQLWLVPSVGNPLKSYKPSTFNERVDLLRKYENSKIKIKTFEKDWNVNSTYMLIKKLKNHYPYTFTLVLGSDSMVDFHHWKNWENIFHETPIAIFSRKGHDHASLRCKALSKFSYAKKQNGLTPIPPSWKFYNTPSMNVSSSFIREKYAGLVQWQNA